MDRKKKSRFESQKTMAESAKRAIKRTDSKSAVSEQQMEELRMAFDMYDEAADGTGTILKSHIKGICDKYGLKISAQEADEMFKDGDGSRSGKITFPEFMNMMANKMKITDTADDLTEAFRIFDPYGEGTIEEKELTDSLTTLGDKLTKEELREMLSVCCVGGVVSYKQFVNQVFGENKPSNEKK